MKTAKQIAKWLEKTATEMHKRDKAECASLFFDEYHDFSLSVGWMDGYDENNYGLDMRSKKEPTYNLCSAIVKYNPMDCFDLKFMDMPYWKDGDVYDTSMTLFKDMDWMSLAEWYLMQYKKLNELIDKGEVYV